MVTVDGQQYWLILKRGKYTGRKYGNKTFNWYAQIIKDGKIIFQKKTNKELTTKYMTYMITRIIDETT